MKRLIFITILSILLAYSSAFAGSLVNEWTERMIRYCEYSNGKVIAVSFTQMCPHMVL